MTVESGQAAPPLDPQASLRTELVGQIASAELALEAAIAELGRDGSNSSLVAASRTQLTSLIGLRRQIGTASSTALADIRAEVAAAVGAASALAQQATASASGAGAPDAATRARAARKTIETVGHDLFDRHVLDDHLQFASAEDEAAYRKREEERRKAYEAELEKHTAKGDHSALAIEQAQLDDAKAHGAGDSAEFAQLQAQVRQAKSGLQEPAPAAGTSTATPNGATSPAPAASGGSLDDVLAALNAAGVTSTTDVASNTGPGSAVARQPARSQNATTGKV